MGLRVEVAAENDFAVQNIVPGTYVASSKRLSEPYQVRCYCCTGNSCRVFSYTWACTAPGTTQYLIILSMISVSMQYRYIYSYLSRYLRSTRVFGKVFFCYFFQRRRAALDCASGQRYALARLVSWRVRRPERTRTSTHTRAHTRAALLVERDSMTARVSFQYHLNAAQQQQ